jgi:hypothetical protein
MPLHGEAIKSCDGQGLKSNKRKDSDHLRKNSLRRRIQWSKICVVRRWCDSPVVEGRRHAINHNAATALTGDLNFKVEGRRSGVFRQIGCGLIPASAFAGALRV